MPAWVCETEPQTGAIRVTDEPATLPADAAQSELCPTICLVCSDAEVTDDESPTCPIVYLRLGTRFDLAPHPGSDFVRVVSGSTRLPSAGLV